MDYRNSWIAAVDRAERPWPLWAGLLYGAAVFGLSMLAVPAVLPLLILPAMDPRVAETLFVLLILGPLMLGGWAGWALIERRPARPRTPVFAPLGLGTGLGTLALLLAVGVCAAVGVLDLKSAGAAGALGLLLSAALTLFAAAAEEVFFRGWLQPLLCARLGPWVGLGLTALLFSVGHFIGNPAGVLAGLNGLLAGLLFGLLALRTGSLAAPIAAHFAWNWIEKAGLGLFPNPGLDVNGALFDFELNGPGVWTGGAAALNGALPATLGLALAVGALVLPLLPGVGRR